MNNVQLAGNHAVYIRVSKLLLEFECRWSIQSNGTQLVLNEYLTAMIHSLHHGHTTRHGIAVTSRCHVASFATCSC